MAQRGELMDGLTYEWKISLFYRTLSPIGADAQKVVMGRGTEELTDGQTHQLTDRPKEIASYRWRDAYEKVLNASLQGIICISFLLL